MKSGRNASKKIWTIFLCIFLAGFLACVCWLIYYWIGGAYAKRQTEQMKEEYVLGETGNVGTMSGTEAGKADSTKEPSVPEASSEPAETEGVVLDDLEYYDVPARTIDFQGLWEQCPDVYAWLYIPGTDIDYPVVQHPTDTNYYLRRSMDGKKSTAGTIFTQNYNAKDWSDHNTVIYGHNMRNGSMFASLHNFEEEEVFEEYRYVYLYTPEDIKVYEIFASYAYSDVHLLTSFDTGTEEGFGEYLEEVYAQEGKRRSRFHDEVKVSVQDRIITLSTCIRGEADNRYLVQAKLVAEGASGGVQEEASQEVPEGALEGVSANIAGTE